jgi:undecaprenyl-diphosphatase
MTARERSTAVIALGVIALVTGAILVSDQRYLPGEGAVVDAVNEWPRIVGMPLEVVMDLGTLFAGLLITAIVAVVTMPRGPRPTIAVGCAVVIAWRLDNVVKEIVERPRPPAVLDDLTVREASGGWGFPSGHTALAFALAAVLHPVLPPKLRWVPWALAACVGIARMYVGVHFPMDLVGGATLGIAIGAAAALLVGGYGRRPT